MKKIQGRKKKWFQNRIVPVFLGCIMIGIFFFRVCFVEALLFDSKLEKNRVDGVYAIASFQGEQHLYYLDMYTLNGIVSYCIDLGAKITTDIYHSTNDFSITYLPSEAIRYIQGISYFGYLYRDHTDYQYYMAAQEIIWEYLTGGQVEWSSELSLDGPRINIDSYKREILKLRDQYYAGLSFQNHSVYKIGDKVVLYDKTGNILDYEVESSGHGEAWIDGNALHIQIANDYVGEESIVLKRKDDYSSDSKLYYYDTSQKLISVGNFLEKRVEISFFVKGADLTFQLVDGNTKEALPSGQASLEGAIYQLYDQNGNLVEEFMTDAYGKACVTNLPHGDYMVRQIQESTGYLLNDRDVFLSFDESDLPVLLEEYPIQNQIEFFKVYEDRTLGYQPESGAEFSIYTSDGVLFDTVITDENGLSFFELPYGYYYVQQNTSLTGYDKVEDFEIIVDHMKNEVDRYDLVDALIRCQLKISTVDSKLFTPILEKGFLYQILDVSTNQYLSFDGQSIFSTNEKGELIVPVLLSYGSYQIEQVGVPEKFVHKQEIQTFIIDDHSNFEIVDGRIQVVVLVVQDLIEGNLNILTNREVFQTYSNGYDYTKVIRENVTLNLIAQEDIMMYDQVIYADGEKVSQIVTNKVGEGSLEGIPLGSYCLVEVESELKSCFSLHEKNSVEGVVSQFVEMTLYLDKMDIVVHDVGENGEDISGATIEVYDPEKNLIYTGITDDEGILKVLGVPSGRYCFQQKKVDNQYLLNSQEICLEIDDSTSTWNIEMKNLFAPKKWISVPNTLSNNQDMKKLIFLIFVIVGGFLYWKKVRIHSSH